jgi:hypothetical protein
LPLGISRLIGGLHPSLRRATRRVIVNQYIKDKRDD